MTAERTLSDALQRLDRPCYRMAEAATVVPAAPGLYAIHGAPTVWLQLGLGPPPDGRPLYVGKAERSLANRDVRTHFSTGKTGSSTLRRSLAGLLAADLRLIGQPRNLANPERFANFSLNSEGDERLTAWMVQQLKLAVWPSPEGVVLDEIETLVLSTLHPPLNIDKVATPWRPIVRAGRKRLADEARRWSPAEQFVPRTLR